MTHTSAHASAKRAGRNRIWRIHHSSGTLVHVLFSWLRSLRPSPALARATRPTSERSTPVIVAAVTAVAFTIVSIQLSAEPTYAETEQVHTSPFIKHNASTVEPVPVDDMSQFLINQTQLKQHTLSLRFDESLHEEVEVHEWNIDLGENSHLIVKHGAEAILDPLQINRYLQEEVEPALPAAEHIVLVTLPELGETKAQITGDRIRDGYRVSAHAAQYISDAVSAGFTDIVIPTEYVHGKVINATGEDLGPFELLARSKSDFDGSPEGRRHNVRTIHRYINGTVIAADQFLSFNDLFGGSVSTAAGWRLSLGIFAGGAELRPVVGGGICQGSTTLYRALLAMGAEIVEQSNHSLYIPSYYGTHGDGLDATIYLKHKNLVARNNTPGHIFFHSYTEGSDAYVEVYGTPDRTVNLEGPYRAANTPDDVRAFAGRNLKTNEIAWRQQVRHDSGKTETRILISRYNNGVNTHAPALASDIPRIGVLEPPPHAVAPPTDEPVPAATMPDTDWNL